MKLPPEQIHYIDRPDVEETFADSLHMITFDGFTMRVEFCVTRLDPPKTPNDKATAQKYPVCRLVIPPVTAIDLFNQLQQHIHAMEQKGIVKKGASPIVPPKH